MRTLMVGTRIKRLREAADMSQQALAVKAGVSMRTVVYAERGRDLRMSTLQSLAKALGVSVGQLLGERQRAS